MAMADDDAVNYEQARRLRDTMTIAGIDRKQLWLHYFSIGGDASEFELDAYLHQSLVLSFLQRDLFAQAANEILIELRPPKAPFAADLLDGHRFAGRDTEPDGEHLTGPAADGAGHKDQPGGAEALDRDDPCGPGH